MVRSAALVLALSLVPGLVVQAQARPESRDRAGIPEEYRWDLSHIYADWGAWEADLKSLEEKMGAFEAFKGTLAQGPDQLLKVLQAQDELEQLFYKTYSYPGLMSTQDMRDNSVQAKEQQVYLTAARFEQTTAWLTPELLQIPEATMAEWLEGSEELAVYRFPLQETYRQQEHVLDEEGERLLAYAGPLGSTPGNVYSMLSTADVDFPTTTLADGTEVQCTHATYERARSTYTVQADREAVFKCHFSVYDDHANTYAAIYDGVLQRDWFTAQARSYSSGAEMKLDANDIPVEVLDNLLRTAREGAGPLQRYHQLRKERLGVETYHYYDAYLPLVDVDWTLEYDEVQPMVVDSVKVFGKDYQATVRSSFEQRWIDVYETEGKRSGAFSWGVYGVHPYMLLNHADTLTDAFTVAHEMGHTMHSVLSMENQPFATHDYTIFVAEVASMTNEDLFLDYLLERTKDPKKRVALLQRAIDDLTGGFYRQAMFADFELRAHAHVEEGNPVTAQALQEIYLGTLRDYFGDALDGQDEYANTWARIPHFYNSSFYVYQYATSKAAASLQSERMLQGSRKQRKGAVAAHLELLSSGGDASPMAQLQEAGIDFSTTAPMDALVKKMDMLVTELEEELDKLSE